MTFSPWCLPKNWHLEQDADDLRPSEMKTKPVCSLHLVRGGVPDAPFTPTPPSEGISDIVAVSLKRNLKMALQEWGAVFPAASSFPSHSGAPNSPLHPGRLSLTLVSGSCSVLRRINALGQVQFYGPSGWSSLPPSSDCWMLHHACDTGILFLKDCPCW